MERRRDLEGMQEVDRRRVVSPGFAGRLVVVAVPAQVQAGARPELQDAKRLARAVRDLEKPSQERGAAADLVRLAWPLELSSHPLDIAFQELAEPPPRGGRIAIAAGPSLVQVQLRQLAGEDLAVDGRQQPQRDRGSTILHLETTEHVPYRPAGLQVGGRRLEQPGVER